MAWTDVKTISSSKRELRDVVQSVMRTLSSTSPLANYGLYQVKLYQLLNFLWVKKSIPPLEVALLLTKRPELLNLAYRLRMTELKEQILLKTQTAGTEKDEAFAVLFYDNYRVTHQVWKSIRATMKYPYEKFDLQFIHEVFSRYPYLKSPSHLSNVLGHLQVVRSAYLLVQQYGIKDVYDV